jgi:hypothetical protein
MQDVMTVLASLYQAREAVKQALYEISGISDIVRGASKASETATAQRIKGQFATLRLDSMQKDVARFSRDIIGIMTEIIAEHFDLETIKQISGVPLLTEEQKAMITQAAQMGQPISPEQQKFLKEPSWEQVHAIIKDDMARCFSIDVETDSTIKIDQEQDKKDRSEFLAAASNFLQQAVQVQDPKMRPLLGEMLMFGVKGFKVGRDLEAAFVSYIDFAKEQADVPPAPPPPDPSLEISRMQAQQQAEANQAQMQIKSAELQLKKEVQIAGVQVEQQKLQLESRSLDIKEQEIMINAELEKQRLQMDMQKTILSAVQQKQAEQPEVPEEPEEDDKPEVDVMAVVDSVSAALQNGLSQIAQAQVISSNNIANAISNPPEKKIVRDKAGNITGVK